MTMVSPDDGRPSISRTTRYKKITKPLLERKRRARINRCLDELKDLMVGAFEMEGDNISKLEKADILELTVRHLTKLHSPRDPIADAKRFQAGFGQCAAEACQFILSMPEIDKQISQNLVRHLTSQISDMPLSVQVPQRQTFSPPISPSARSSWSGSSGRAHHSSQHASPVEVAPINKSPYVPLVCDTMSSTPSVQDLSKPMTGLLMTVDNNPSQPSYNSYAQEYKNATGNAEAKKKYDAEVKHVIMKKIRDQILGRQIKEHEVRDNVLPTTYEQSQMERHYQRPNTTYKNPYITEYGQNESMDLRKKSKAEYKHYSPRLVEDVSVKQSQICYEQSIPQNVIKYNSKQQDRYVPEQSEEMYNIRKRTADYRSIHPKKILIRPISDMQVTSSVKQDQYKRQYNVDNGGTSSQRHYEYRYSQANSSTSMPNMRPENSDSEQEENMWRPW